MATPPPAAALARAAESPAPGDRAAGGEASTVPPALARKIIYNARLTLVVESVGALSERLTKLVKDAGGYVSETDQSSDTRSQRHASWTVRVPVERFDGFLAAVGRLGELQQSHVDSQDVTQEFYDTEARVTNKQTEEKRLQKHLSDSTGKLDDILAVERELSRVRGEVEQMQGRIRYLTHHSALSTVTVIASEVRDYTPPVHPTFATQVARTFERSLTTLREFGEVVVLIVVALVPWVPVFLVLAAPLVLWGRRRRAARRAPVVLTRPER